jgi:C-terminal processing protease CtpA/Prc
MRSLWITAFLLFVALLAGGAYWWHVHGVTAATSATYQTAQEAQNVYVRFDMEAYDDIEASYWQQAGDPQLSQLFQLSLEKAASTSSEPLATTTRAAVAQMLYQAFSEQSTTSQEQLAVQTLEVALYNLAPTGRDNLLSNQAQTQLQNTVNNVNPSNDLYGDLGLPDNASSTAVAQAVAQKTAALSATTSAAGKQELQQVQQAASTLSNPTAKAIYDQTGAEATVFTHVLNGHTLYIDISSVAPSTIAEFTAAIDSASTTPALNNLIIDLRGNIGGDLSFAQEFLALFFGPNQYAFDLFHQSNLDVQRTAPIPKDPTISQFKQIAVLTDGMTQSTAELAASALKHDHLAIIVGTTTRGWGSVEQIVAMKTQIDPTEQYALELVVYLTVRYDGLPIEGNGVVPDVNVSDPDWKSQLSNYIYSPYLISALEAEATNPPLH